MTTTTTRPRLLNTVDLLLPASQLEAAVFRWASQLGVGAIYSIAQLEGLRGRLEDSGRQQVKEDAELALDVQLALGAITARAREPAEGWDAYVRAWSERVLSSALGYGTQMDQLRDLQDQFGGLLLNGRGAAFVLLIPCKDGTWVKLGWATATLLSGNPLQTVQPVTVRATVHAGGAPR